jgi:16S rRNA (cytidine1402-2'-O)-methyltransferase
MAGGGTLYVVGTPIGNLEDLSPRAARILGEVTLIAAEDTRSAARLLGHCNAAGRRVVSLFEGNEAARTEELVGELLGGARIALISEAGMPAISDPGERLVRAAAAAGVPVEVVPGPVAAIAALVASGLPADRFLFLGFPPREQGARRELLGTLRGEPGSLIFYEAPDRVGATLADLAAGLGAARPACLSREITKLYEEHVRAPLGELAARYAETPPRGECVIVVGGAPAGEGGAHDPIDIEGELRKLLASGLGPKDAAARLVVVTGKPRRQLYQLALSLQRERGREPDDGEDA